MSEQSSHEVTHKAYFPYFLNSPGKYIMKEISEGNSRRGFTGNAC